ncbi:MAG TPA: hypothetical protein IAB63_02570 [Candidatus Onthocola gallistercoris]|uniref:Uncharacterized protein n=1 Tax=Candidatus Onthocola gallistercoris TaxID=2840876 RepID=A0A9D1KX62_9FIRM|nr:hypothetical protein [Candidatus Onthocola gallistercoris]
MKKIKKSTIVKAKQASKHILEFYYMIPAVVTAKELTRTVRCVEEEAVDIWPELNLMEVVLEHDSLILQDGRECFIDPLDLEFIEENHIQSIFAVSYEEADEAMARKALKDMMTEKGGFLCSDTEDFTPMWTAETIA